MIKVLVITYYWPPSGGAGVQRWLKLTKYLAELGAEVHVLTVDPAKASYMHVDKSLLQDVSPKVHVHKTNSFEPINYYAKIVGKKNVPTAGFSNVDNSNVKQKLVNSLRSHLFIPDPRKGWNTYALKEAKKIIKEHDIDVVVSTSPPHSSQLIGLKLKQQLGVKWLADLRDPWTDIYYYDILGHSKLSHTINLKKERDVLTHADRITTVSMSLKRLFSEKYESVNREKISVIPNGWDKEDFAGVKKEGNKVFTIMYTGTMSENYAPEAFLECLGHIKNSSPQTTFLFKLIGIVAKPIARLIEELGINFELMAPVPHSEIVWHQKQADLLLLVIPNTEKPEGILTGKLFEYLATGSPIIGIGPPEGDASKIINECQAGRMFGRSEQDEMSKFILKQHQYFVKGQTFESNKEAVESYSRKSQAKQFLNLIQSLKDVQ
jgi:glycosyltransferase involved in cell wall biosynthesis